MMNREKRYLTCPLEVRGVDVEGDVGIIRGYASVFNVFIESYREVVRPGAFKQTIKHTGGIWPITKYHDLKKWLGNNVHAEEDKKGLFTESQLLINDLPGAREEFALVRHTASLGRNAQQSIGFWTVKYYYDKKADTTELTEVAMGEHAIIPPGFAANPDAEITETRAADFHKLLAILAATGILPEVGSGANISEADKQKLQERIIRSCANLGLPPPWEQSTGDDPALQAGIEGAKALQPTEGATITEADFHSVEQYLDEAVLRLTVSQIQATR